MSSCIVTVSGYKVRRRVTWMLFLTHITFDQSLIITCSRVFDHLARSFGSVIHLYLSGENIKTSSLRRMALTISLGKRMRVIRRRETQCQHPKPDHGLRIHLQPQRRWYILTQNCKLDCWGEEDSIDSCPRIMHIVEPFERYLFTVWEWAWEVEGTSSDCHLFSMWLRCQLSLSWSLPSRMAYSTTWELYGPSPCFKYFVTMLLIELIHLIRIGCA